MLIQKTFSEAPPVIVLGDVMLDSYVEGRVDRVSPEAPVPVLRKAAERHVAGGAANVALNVASVGGTACLIGLVGRDADAGRLRAVLAAQGLDGGDLVESDEAETIVKTRVMDGNGHQFVRIDRETVRAPSEAAEREVLDRLDAALPGAGVLILSDYAKGLLSDGMIAGAMARAKEHGVPVMVDPKRRDFTAYRGAAVIKPNLSELRAASGLHCEDDAATEAAALAIARETGADLLVTMSERGMLFVAADGADPIHAATRARQVFDVSGAGDTTMAVFALCRAAGMTVGRAMHVANEAAGVVVAKSGTATLTAHELDAAFEKSRIATGSQVRYGGRVLSQADARSLIAAWRAEGLSVGFTNGCFDLVHPGHVRILHGARSVCDRLVVGLNSDASVRRLKGETRPIQSEEARAAVVAAISGVDAVVLFGEDTPREILEVLEPDVLVKGADYEVEQIVGAAEILARGGRVERIPLVDGQSTSALVARSKGGAA